MAAVTAGPQAARSVQPLPVRPFPHLLGPRTGGLSQRRGAGADSSALGAEPSALAKAEEPANDQPLAKKRGRKPAAARVARSKPAAPPSGSPVDLIDGALDLARQCGGVAELKRLVDKIADMQG
jgi:hypothetical protein